MKIPRALLSQTHQYSPPDLPLLNLLDHPPIRLAEGHSHNHQDHHRLDRQLRPPNLSHNNPHLKPVHHRYRERGRSHGLLPILIFSSFRTGFPRSTLRRDPSRKISRHFPSRTSIEASNAPPLPTEPNGASSSGIEQVDEADEIPTSPSTEFPDHFNAFLPGYYQSVHEDPNASTSLGFASGVPVGTADYTSPPPLEEYEESIAASDDPSLRGRYQSVASTSSITERWNAAADVSSFICLFPPFLLEFMLIPIA